MKTYTLVLDIFILLLLGLSVQFCTSQEVISNSFTRHNGSVRLMTVSWQTLLGLASFCVGLRYVARNLV